jgi:uncharacterized protein
MVQPFHEGSVRGFLHVPDQPNGDALVITHGAGGDCRMPLLIAVADTFATVGITVLRCDLPFRQARAKGPPFPSTAAIDRAGLRDACTKMRGIAHGRLFLGGQSYGGRQASMLAAEGRRIADALLLLSYPLHPPAKPEQLRTAHFPSLRTPALFVQGANDPFGSQEELQAAIALIPAKTKLIEVPRAAHDLARGRFDITELALDPLRQLLEP